MSHSHAIRIFVNQHTFEFATPNQTGKGIKEHAQIPLCDTLYLDESAEHPSHENSHHDNKNAIENDEVVTLKNGQKFHSHPHSKPIVVTINRHSFTFHTSTATGRALKAVAAIELTDVLFRSERDEDEVIPNDTSITLHNGDCFYSAPPANYGLINLMPTDIGNNQYHCIEQPDGWTLIHITDFHIPDGFNIDKINLLLKIPPGFPDAAPDMFWVTPHLKTLAGAVPQGTSLEALLGEEWQRFSWHLQPGAWRPGISTLRDFLRCVHARFEKRN